MRRILAGIFIVLLIPYIMTLALSDSIRGEEKHTEIYSGRKIYLDRQQKGYVDVEEYLIGVLARQIPADYELEAIKAQAMIARTYVYRQMKGKSEIMESELNLEALKEGQMETLWGNADFVEYYEKMQTALEETAGKVIFYDGQLIEPLFHRASAGKTRNGDTGHPYLTAVDSRRDVETENFMTVMEWTPEEFTDKINRIGSGTGSKSGSGAGSGSGNENRGGIGLTQGQVMDTLQLVRKDEAGYVEEIQIGSHIYTGDEIRAALGLPSSSFSFREIGGKIQAICKGIGHGYGLSQWGANCMAKEGSTAEEILNYYYENITINFEES